MARVDNLLARARGLDPQTVDYLTAGCLAVLAVVQFADTRHPLPAAVIGALGAGAVATRRRATVLSILAIAAASVLIAVTDHGVDQGSQGLAACLCFYTLGRSAGQRAKPVIDAALLALAVFAIAVTPPQPASRVAVTWLVFIAVPYVAGRTVESRRALTHELGVNAERARREQEAQARSAAAEERTRIARELHDVIAHNLSVMVIQAVAAREVASTDSVAASAALAAVQLAGREALLEMRRMIGVLRRGDVELAARAAPGLEQLDLLAQRARMSGLAVELNVRGRRRALPEALDLVAFRVVQEALTNSIKHARPARAYVTITFGENELELEICDDGRSGAVRRPADPGTGHGLVGMRERLALFDGQLSAGARPDGGFRVHARLPVEDLVPA